MKTELYNARYLNTKINVRKIMLILLSKLNCLANEVAYINQNISYFGKLQQELQHCQTKLLTLGL